MLAGAPRPLSSEAVGPVFWPPSMVRLMSDGVFDERAREQRGDGRVNLQFGMEVL